MRCHGDERDNTSILTIVCLSFVQFYCAVGLNRDRGIVFNIMDMDGVSDKCKKMKFSL